MIYPRTGHLWESRDCSLGLLVLFWVWYSQPPYLVSCIGDELGFFFLHAWKLQVVLESALDGDVWRYMPVENILTTEVKPNLELFELDWTDWTGLSLKQIQIAISSNLGH